MEPSPRNALESEGFAVVPDVLDRPRVDRLRTLMCQEQSLAEARRGASVYGARNLLALGPIRDLAAEAAVWRLIEPVVGTEAIPVRALFFDKTPEANWPVLWHQDLTIAVAARHDLPGWGPWSIKAGVVHVEPPQALLSAILTIRLHLDDCGADNGPLRVIPGSHRTGRLTRGSIAAAREAGNEHRLVAPAGAAILMRPLLLHASSPATEPHHRRVIHIEFAARDLLPPQLQWASEQRESAA
jgi:ectoine hydroxylase-related dioxygenase (phytanoyl-CoA dioxygenase family)